MWTWLSTITTDTTVLLIIIVFFLLVGYRPPWWNVWWRPHKSHTTSDDDSPPLSAPPHPSSSTATTEYLDDMDEIPGPLPLPLLGTSWLCLFGLDRLHEVYEWLFKKYGMVVKEMAPGNIPVLHLFDRKDIEKVLRSGGKYPLRPPAEALAYYRKSRPDRYATMGLVNEQGESWHSLRTSLTTTLTSPRTISDFLSEASDIADAWCQLIKQSRIDHHLIPHLEGVADRLSLELTCAFVLGRRMGFLQPGFESDRGRLLAEAVRQHFLATRDTYFGPPFWKYIPTRCYRRLVKNEETIYDLVMELIGDNNSNAIFSPVLKSIINSDIDPREKTASIVDFIAAGIHTFKNSLVFLLHAVGRCSQIQTKILEDSSRSYLRACVTESFRLYPTAYALGRISEVPLELGGYRVPAGTPLVCQTGLACRNPENFRNPLEFRPERWLGEERAQCLANGSFVLAPFGAGRRICPGKRLVEQILPVLLERAVETFEIEAPDKLELHFEFLLAPKGPTKILFKDRT